MIKVEYVLEMMRNNCELFLIYAFEIVLKKNSFHSHLDTYSIN
jgi:hypothetical protein